MHFLYIYINKITEWVNYKGTQKTKIINAIIIIMPIKNSLFLAQGCQGVFQGISDVNKGFLKKTDW